MSEKVCAESGREALAVRLERIEATIKERVEDGTFVPAMTPADPGKSIGDALVRAVRSGAPAPGAAPADLVGEQVLPALRAGATHVTVDKLDPPMYLLEVLFETITGGTIGTSGIVFRYSLDGGETWSPNTGLGTATTLVLNDGSERAGYAPPPDMSDASIMAERPGQVFDFAKGTWVDRTPEGYDTNGGSVAGVGIRYLEAPGEAAVNASAPSGLRVKA